MFLNSIHSAFPPNRFTQQESYDGLAATPSFDRLRPGSRALLEKILLRSGGIDTRHFCVPEIGPLVESDPGELNHLFEREGRRLGADAMKGALEKAGLQADDLDALLVCSCTGYLCPGLSSHVAEELGMRPDIYLQDLVGLGCGAAIPTLRSAHGLAKADPSMKIGVIAIELCSAAFYMDDDPGVLISLCLFGDGANASIWSGEGGDGAWEAGNFQTLHLPQHRDLLRFENEKGFLRNRLDRQVPALAAKAVKQLHDQAGASLKGVISHGGGRDVVDAVEKVLGCGELDLTREVLSQYGNLSSPSVLVSLELALEAGPSTDRLWLTSFGAGFAAHACQLRRI